MASPLIIGTTASIVALVNKKRADIRLQNAGTSVIYIKKIPLTGVTTTVSSTDFEFRLNPLSEPTEGAESFSTNSIASFMAISSTAGGILAIYETSKV